MGAETQPRVAVLQVVLYAGQYMGGWLQAARCDRRIMRLERRYCEVNKRASDRAAPVVAEFGDS